MTLLALALVGCSGDGASGGGAAGAGAAGAGAQGGSGANAGAGSSSGGDAGSGNGGSGGSKPTPGPSAEGWQKDYVDGSALLDCAWDAAKAADSAAARITVEDSTLYVGYEQVGQNQNPVVMRVDAGSQTYCVRHETEGPDGRALGLTWDGGDVAYVVYTIVGGGSALDGLAKGGFVPGYAPGSISGGGSKVSFIGRLAVPSGELSAGSFIIAVKSDNKVNSHGPAGAPTVLPDGNVEFLGGSAHKPIDIGLVAMDCTDYPFDSRYVLKPDLSAAVCAECSNCVSKQPCN